MSNKTKRSKRELEKEKRIKRERKLNKILSETDPKVLGTFCGIIYNIYEALREDGPGKWTVNFADGSSGNSVLYKNDFINVPLDRRQTIRAFRLQSKHDTYTISRRVKIGEEEVVSEGFFFHLKAGRHHILGRWPVAPRFSEERFGFCFNSNGDAMTIRFKHKSFFKEIGERITKVEDLAIKRGKFILDKKVKSILIKDVNYKVDTEWYVENLNAEENYMDGTKVPHGLAKPVNIGLFGNLDSFSLACPICESRYGRSESTCSNCVNSETDEPIKLKEDLGTPPRVLENNREVVIPIGQNMLRGS